MKTFTKGFKFLSKSLILVALIVSVQAFSQEFTLGAHSGALGRGNQTEIAYGAHINVNPLGWAALEIDATFARFNNNNSYFSSSPGIVLYPIDFDAFKVGFVGGPGFYKYQGHEIKFGLHGGMGGEFSLLDNFVVGMQTQYHGVFDSVANGGIDVWNVFVTFGYRFEVDGGW